MTYDTDNDLAVAATTVLSALSDQIKRKPKRDKWVQPWIVQHPINGAYHAQHFYTVSLAVTLHYIKTDAIQFKNKPMT